MRFILGALIGLLLFAGIVVFASATHGGSHVFVRAGALCRPWSETNLHTVMMAGAFVDRHYRTRLVVTSCRSWASGRVPNSLHPLDRAVDMTWEAYTIQQGRRLADWLVAAPDRLGADYDCVAETRHLHCEYDPKIPKEIVP